MGRKIAAGNWKMNGVSGSLLEISALAEAFPDPDCEILICPPFTLVSRVADAAGTTAIATGGQDCHPAPSGAHTGDVSAAMLADAGATFVILGHSERRADHGETDGLVRDKTEAAWAAGLTAIVCVGETLDQRETGQTLDVVGSQLSGSLPESGGNADTLIIAYEPVWAIGTGKVPTLEEIAEVHAFIRGILTGKLGDDTGAGVGILYGGSVKPSNAAEIFGVANVDGALVGGASLKASDFGGIVAALEAGRG